MATQQVAPTGPPVGAALFCSNYKYALLLGNLLTAFAIKLEANNGHQAAPKKRGKK